MRSKRLSARHVPSLDGYRGVAFLFVFLRHYTLTSHLTSTAVRTAMTIGQAGWIGVDLFFALSGFLITGILLDTRSREGYFRVFFIRRALRIFPLFYGVAIVLLLLTSVLHLQWEKGQLAYLFYLGNVAALLNSNLTVVKPAVSLLHLWSLAVEEQFYLLWPLVIFSIRRLRHLAWACVGLSGVAFILRLALLERLPTTVAEEWSYNLLFTHMDGLLAGALGAVLIRAVPLFRLMPAVKTVSVASGIATLAVFSVSGSDFHALPMSTVGYPLLAVFFTSLLLQALDPNSAAAKFGNLPFLRFFGKYSYGLYVYHYILSPLTSGVQTWLQFRMHSRLVGGLAYTLLVFIATIGVAVLSYHLYEEQWLKLKSRFTYGQSSQVDRSTP